MEAPTVRVRAYRVRGARFERPVRTAARWHSVLFLRGGAFEVRASAGRAAIDLHGALVLNDGDEYELRAPSPYDDRVTEIEIHPDVVADVACETDRLPPGAKRVDTALFRRHLNLWQLARRHDLDPLAFEERALGIVDAALRSGVTARRASACGPATRRAHQRLALDVQAILGKRFDERLTIAALADAAGCSPHHLCRVFRAEVGQPIHRYVTALRLRTALALLAEGPRDLTMLAMDLGYSSHAHFTAAFRREFGFVPSRTTARAG